MASVEHWAETRTSHSFELFYQEEYPAVVALVLGLSGSRWAAEDLAQEAFLRAHRDWSRVCVMESPTGWVRRVAINLALSRLRRLRAEAKALARMVPTSGWQQPQPVEYEAFWREVRRLPRRQAQAIALRYVDGLSVKEIAQVLDVAEGTAKALMYQGRERLRERLRSQGWIDDET